MTKTKVCTKCIEEKELDEFYNMKSGKYGKDTYCKVCRAKVSAEYEKNNRKHRNEYRLNYYHKNKLRIKARKQAKNNSA